MHTLNLAINAGFAVRAARGETYHALLALHVAVAAAAVRLRGGGVVRVLAVELGDGLHLAAPGARFAGIARRLLVPLSMGRTPNTHARHGKVWTWDAHVSVLAVGHDLTQLLLTAEPQANTSVGHAQHAAAHLPLQVL